MASSIIRGRQLGVLVVYISIETNASEDKNGCTEDSDTPQICHLSLLAADIALLLNLRFRLIVIELIVGDHAIFELSVLNL